jgi:hypothetical protein
LQLLFDVPVKVAPKSFGTHRHEDNTRPEIYGLKSVAHHGSSAQITFQNSNSDHHLLVRRMTAAPLKF